MTERNNVPKSLQLPPDAGLRLGVDVGGAEYLPPDKMGPEIIRPIGSGRSLTRWELHNIQSERSSNDSEST